MAASGSRWVSKKDTSICCVNMTYLSLRCFPDCSKDAADGRDWLKVAEDE